MAIVIGLITLGATLLFLETILPGLVAGVLGVICLLAGVILGYSSFGPEGGTWILLAVGAGLTGGAAAYLKFFPQSWMARRFVSQRVIGSIGTERPELVGQNGVAHSTLRPAGTAVIQGERVDVLAEGPLIERGTHITVIAVEGMRVVVRAV